MTSHSTLDKGFKMSRILPACLVFVSALTAVDSMAQDSSTSGEWHQSLDIYLLGPTIAGTAGIGPVEADVNVDAESVFKNLKGAFLGMYAAEKDGWGVFADIVYMDLEADIGSKDSAVSGEIGNKQFTGAVSATRRVSPQWQILAGAMYTDISMSLRTSGPLGGQNRGRSESWVDPFLGAKFETPLGERWNFGGFGYLGGFGVGSDLMWSLNAGFAYRFSKRNSLTLMYRYIDFDYEDGKGLNRFKFDIAEHGPAVGWRFSF